MSEAIFHITSRQAWTEARPAGEYRAPSLATEGFIHCSTRLQVVPVAEAFYPGGRGLVLLVIDLDRLSSTVKWEPAASSGPRPAVGAEGLFPHIYGAIPAGAVLQVLDFEPAADGHFALPAGL